MTNMDCKNCKYDYDKWCAKRNACADCPLYDADRPMECYCTMIGRYDKCPCFEPMEEEVDE